MKKSQFFVFSAVLSLIIGISVSIWSYYFIEYSYYSNDGYNGISPNCQEYANRVSCIGLTDYETSGFPFQFSRSDWEYNFKNGVFDENTIISTESNFSWPLFLFNSLVWSIASFLVIVLFRALIKRLNSHSRN